MPMTIPSGYVASLHLAMLGRALRNAENGKELKAHVAKHLPYLTGKYRDQARSLTLAAAQRLQSTVKDTP